MDVQAYVTTGNLTYAFGAASLLLSGWLTVRGWNVPRDAIPNAAAAAMRIAGKREPGTGSGDVLRLPIRSASSRLVAERMRGGLRLPLSMPETGPGSVGPGISAAHEILCAALEHPDAPHPRIATFLQGLRSGKGIGRPEPLHHAYRDGAASRAGRDHAWWETLLLDLMISCRAAGSWIAPSDLDPLLVDRPDIAAALRAGRDGTVAPAGAAIVAHWKAEEAAGVRLRLPRTEGGLAALVEASS